MRFLQLIDTKHPSGKSLKWPRTTAGVPTVPDPTRGRRAVADILTTVTVPPSEPTSVCLSPSSCLSSSLSPPSRLPPLVPAICSRQRPWSRLI
eukprot:239904-Hanusia_phi.AAC.4